MSSDQPLGWNLGKAPKQSITEVLQNPRGATLALELPDVSTLDFSSTTLSLTPAPPTTLPDALDINHFEGYIRRYAPLHNKFLEESHEQVATPRHDTTSLSAIPPFYFHETFSVSTNDQLAQLQLADSALSQSGVSDLRAQLAAYKTQLEREMKHRLDARSTEISSSLANIRTLRAKINATTTAIHSTRASATALLPTVTSGLLAARALSAARRNLHTLRDATNDLQVVVRAPEDAELLLSTGEFSAAIDTILRAKDLLSLPHFTALHALSGVRARLASCVERVDSVLRDQFRAAMHAPQNAQTDATLRTIVQLLARIGRVEMLQRAFLKELKVTLAAELARTKTLQAAARCLRENTDRARAFLTVLHAHSSEAGLEEALQSEQAKKNLGLVRNDFEELMAAVVDRLLGSFPVVAEVRDGMPSFVVITPSERVTSENCFDEFKAAMRFGVEMRGMEALAAELDDMVGGERRASVLRAKLSERLTAFLGTFHRAHVDAMNQTIKADKWQEVAVPEGALRLISAVTGEPMRNDAELKGSANGSAHGVAAETGEGKSDSSGSVLIGGTAFKTVVSGVRYVRSLCAYTLVVEQVPNLSVETARHAVELPRLFNSLVGKAILGLAALKWSGLRTITARHLSLASRTVSMAAALSVHVNSPLRKVLSGPKAQVILPLIDSSEKDLRDHHAQLLAKILAIMMDRLEVHENVIKALPWDKSHEMQRFEMPSGYIVTLAKEATVLHRILWSILPKVEVHDIFQRVCAAYGTHLTETYGSLDGGKKWVRTRVARDVTCLHERLEVLDVFKENAAAFKPLTRLYNRFAKEFNDAAAAEKTRKDSFIRKREPNPPISGSNASQPQQSKPENSSQVKPPEASRKAVETEHRMNGSDAPPRDRPEDVSVKEDSSATEASIPAVNGASVESEAAEKRDPLMPESSLANKRDALQENVEGDKQTVVSPESVDNTKRKDIEPTEDTTPSKELENIPEVEHSGDGLEDGVKTSEH